MADNVLVIQGQLVWNIIARYGQNVLQHEIDSEILKEIGASLPEKPDWQFYFTSQQLDWFKSHNIEVLVICKLTTIELIFPTATDRLQYQLAWQQDT